METSFLIEIAPRSNQNAPITGVFKRRVSWPMWRVEKLPPADRKRLGKTVVSYRTKLGLTQEQVAEQANIDRRFIQKIEAGELGSSLAVLKRLRRVLKITWDALLDGI